MNFGSDQDRIHGKYTLHNSTKIIQTHYCETRTFKGGFEFCHRVLLVACGALLQPTMVLHCMPVVSSL